jgi:hypothetical protein
VGESKKIAFSCTLSKHTFVFQEQEKRLVRDYLVETSWGAELQVSAHAKLKMGIAFQRDWLDSRLLKGFNVFRRIT